MRKICKNYVPASVEEIQTRMKRLRENRHLPKNRVPNPAEVRACTPYLNRQIKIIQPEIIVTLGRHATSYVLSEAGIKEVVGITKLRGKVYSVKLFGLPVSVLPMFHPAAVLHNPKYKDALEHDFHYLKSLVEKSQQGH